MKDIDFDELDRAVSSVLGQVTPGSVAVSADGKVAVTSTPKKTAIVSRPVDTEKAPKEQASSADGSESAASNMTSAAKPAVKIQKRGMFMDMVHPSATMKHPMTEVPAEAVTVRKQPVIAPISKDLKAEEAVSETTNTPEPVSVENPSEPTAALDESQSLVGAEPVPVSADPATAVPDTETSSRKTSSIQEASSFTPADEGSDEPTDTEVTSEKELDDVIEPPSSLSSTVPQTTPFLADTKVDKRPLGSFGDADEPDNQVANPEKTTEDNQNTPSVQLPRELQPDVIEVESAPESQKPEAKPFAAKVDVAPEPVDDGRVEGHPLFDTSTYHEPIVAVKKKAMPSWLKWFFGLLFCLAVGAGVGYFLFTAGL